MRYLSVNDGLPNINLGSRNIDEYPYSSRKNIDSHKFFPLYTTPVNTVEPFFNIMDSEYVCYCGFYCECCVVKARIGPAAQNLHKEMKNGGFEDYIKYIPGGNEFWPFLKNMSEKGLCISCKEGGGDPGCNIRNCAKEKDIEMCALCTDYPCNYFEPFKESKILFADNEVLREKGLEEWSKMQDERVAKKFCYSDVK